MNKAFGVYVWVSVCFQLVLCQFGLFPHQREERRYGTNFFPHSGRIRNRLSSLLHFKPDTSNDNPGFIYPFNNRPGITNDGPNNNYYDQYGRPQNAQENYSNINYPTSDQGFVSTNPNYPNQNFDVPNNQNQNEFGSSNVVFTANPIQGHNIVTQSTQENQNTNENQGQPIQDNQNFGQPNQANQEINVNQNQPNQLTNTNNNIPDKINQEVTTPETVKVQGIYFPDTENDAGDSKDTLNAGGKHDEELTTDPQTTSTAASLPIDPATTRLPPLTPVPTSESRNNFNFGTQGIFKETCKTVDGETGSCIAVIECEPYLTLLQQSKTNPAAVQILRAAHCGFNGGVPKVCCPRPGIPTVPPPSQSPATDPPVVTPDPEATGKSASGDYVNALPEPPICGVSNASLSRVVGGIDAHLGDFPWMALLGYKGKRNPGARWLCGGSLVSSRHVLTAAHCIHGHEDDLFIVRLGELDLARDNEGATPVDVYIKSKIKHEQYNSKAFSNDIGLLVLEKEIQFTDLIKPICIPRAPELRAKSFENYNPIIAGWGDTEFRGPAATHLQALQLPVVSNEFCAQAYSQYKSQTIDQRVLCAGYKNGGKDACQGDSGGPLMQPVWNSQEFTTYFYQIGVVSYGKKCAEAGFPGVYTRVTEFVPWLEKNIVGTNQD